MADKNYLSLERFFQKKFKAVSEKKITVFQDFFTGLEEEFQRSGFRENFSDAVENILIVRLDAVGDFILTTGFIREVRKNFPKANITLIVSPLVFPIAEFCPYVNEVFEFDGKMFEKNIFDVVKKIVNFCRDNLWQKHFSMSFNPQSGADNLGGLCLSYLSGARERIGYGTYVWKDYIGIDPRYKENIKADNFLLTENIQASKDFISEVEKHFYILIASNFAVEDKSLELWFGAEDFFQAKSFLKNIPANRRKIVLGIGGGEDNRKYPVKKLLIALKEIAKKNFVFVIVGGKSEIKDAEFLEKNLPKERILNLVGKTTLRETEATISQMDFYIGNDSGVMHMAAAANVPVLAIYREAMDKSDYYPGFYSEFERFPPYQTASVILRPDHALEDCADKKNVYGGCCHSEAHCISQIEPDEIVEGFDVLENLN